MLKFKPDKLKTNLLIMRWAVLGGLVLAVGAVAVFGGARPEQSSGTARQAQIAPVREEKTVNLAEQLQAHISEDTRPTLPVMAALPADAIKPENPENTAEPEKSNEATETQNDSQTPDNNQDNTTAPAEDEAEDEVVDNAPEPWVGDELLTVEANLHKMTPPLSGMLQGSNGILRGFGYGYDAAFDDYRFHGAVDLAGSLGAAVLAPLAGTVKEINEDSFMGQSIVLEHDGKLESAYFGLNVQPGLQKGQQVIAGEKLGELCAPPTFEDSLAPHLHWELRLDGEPLDAAAYGFGS